MTASKSAAPSAPAAPALLAAALSMGIAADSLLRSPSPGLNVAVLVFGVAAWGARLARRVDPERPDASVWPWVAAMALSTAWALRGSETLLAWDLLATLALLTLPVAQAGGTRLREAGIVPLVTGALHTAAGAAGGCANLLLRELPWEEALGRTRLRGKAGIVKGALLAAPVVIALFALFGSADPVFRDGLTVLFDWNFARIFSHLFMTALATWLIAGYLRTAVLARRGAAAPPAVRPLAAEAVVIPLAAAVGTFTLFVGTQLGALFRGAAFIETTAGLTYAEYARAGFFQLIAASGLTLPLLYLAPQVAAPSARTSQTLGALQRVQLALVALVAASALWRLSLYMRAFGLTEDRLFGAAIIVWIIACVGVFALALATRRIEGTAFRAAVAGLSVLGVLNVLNPDATIARVNLSRTTGRELDTRLLARLGPDAVPVIARGLPDLDRDVRCELASRVLRRWEREPRGDWRGWNLPRARAMRSLDAVRGAAPTCVPPAAVTPGGPS